MSVTWKNVKGFIQCLLHPRECSKTVKLLYEFVENELDEPTRQKLQCHLADCPECLRYVETYRRTVQLTHQHGHPETDMPTELQARLRNFIHQNPGLK